MQIRLSDHFTIKKLLLATLPTILMMVFTSIYSIVDGFFVSNFVGESEFVGVNLIMPITQIVGAIGFMFGAGGSALAAKTLGENDDERANKIFSTVIYAATLLALIISAVVFIFLEDIAVALGGENAAQETINNAVLYGRILLGFEVAFILQNAFQSFFVVAEKATLGFIVTVIAGCTNMSLDALFIVAFDWGIVGAAVATGIAQTVGAIIPLIYFLVKKKGLLRLVKTKLMLGALWKSTTNGSSEFIGNVAMSIVGILYNMQLLKYTGEYGVAAYGVIMYAGFIFAAIFLGYGMGVAPIISYHFGAENHRELKGLLRKSLLLTTIFSVVMVILTELLAQPISCIFVGYNQELTKLTANGFRIYGISFGLCGFSIFLSSFFTALNDGLVSAIVSFARTLLFQVICVFALPIFLGLNGIWWSIVAAEGLSVAASFAFLITKRKKYRY